MMAIVGLWLSYSRRRDRNNLGPFRSYYKGGGVPTGNTQIVPKKWPLAGQPAGTDSFNARARRDTQK